MSTPSISGIESMLAQMREVASAAQGLPLNAPSSKNIVGQGSFAAELSRTLAGVSNAENNALEQAQQYQAGKPGVSLNNVMLDLQKANLAFQTTLQVRSRFIAAYQEIASMPV